MMEEDPVPINSFGPRTERVYTALRDRMIRGELVAESKLPPHTELAVEYGVAPLTMRQVLARLEEEGFVTRKQGRGTFVRAHAPAAVLIVEEATAMRVLLEEHVTRAGYRPIPVVTLFEGLKCLSRDGSISLVFSDIRMTGTENGHTFIRTVRRRWPMLPVVALTEYPDDLAGLHGTPECPVLILTKPLWPHQIEETMRLALRR